MNPVVGPADQPATADSDAACDCHVEIALPTESAERIPDEEADEEVDGGADYQAQWSRLGFAHALLIQPPEAGHDHGFLIETISAFPDGCARGIALVRAEIEEKELEDLASSGLIGARFVMLANPARETTLDWAETDRLAWRIHDFGWDVELLMEGADLYEVEQRVRDWPGRIILPHTGGFMRNQSLDQRGFVALTRLIDRDKAWVKLSPTTRQNGDTAEDTAETDALARALIDWAPERMVWGSGQPWSGEARAEPDLAATLSGLAEWVPEESRRARILRHNPVELYGFSRP